LRLRQDNADLRLCEFAEKNGLLSSKKYRVFSEYREKLEKTELECRGRKYQGISIWEHLRNMRGKPTEKLTFPVETVGLALGNSMNGRVFRQLVIAAHYEGYIKREEQAAVKLKKLEQWKIPESFDYKNISGLRNESRLKLEKTTPSTLAQAGRIDGVTPAELALLQVHLKRFKDSIAECR
jgi:tRNA uridine 5-carboxymethylaminomethyl modification enzyme